MLAVGLEGADREQLRRMVTAEDPRFVFPSRGALQELEGELTDDLCTIISTRVRGRAAWGEQPPWGGCRAFPPQVDVSSPCLTSPSRSRSPAPCSAPR